MRLINRRFDVLALNIRLPARARRSVLAETDVALAGVQNAFVSAAPPGPVPSSD